MTFAYPWVLVGLIVPAGLAVLAWRGRARAGRVRMPYDYGVQRRHRAVRTAIAVTQAAAPVLLAIGVVMLAFPQRLQPPEHHRKLTNIQLVLDASGSMEEESPNRYSYARAAIERFTLDREGDAMGLIVFNNIHVRWIPITTDLGAIRLALPFADPKNQPGGVKGTEIGAALRFAAKAMLADAKAEGDRVIILISDGQSPDIQYGRHIAVANELIDAGVTVYYLHIGSDAYEPGAMEIASLTGGRSFVAGDASATLAVFRTLDQMTRTEFVTEQPEPRETFAPFAWASLGACVLHGVALLGVRYTPW